ncbi:hypothetical protein L1D30_26910 [Vibrio harveyi]|uniref:hypothetical protein n=1 Tax=Vibrio harveyi TaxID=669 RepID=UPI001EFC4C91|nr:hypothetical protein [Vibrio harveyi]MCG9589915.1 hypothetical protein [Vibrio harveyi]
MMQNMWHKLGRAICVAVLCSSVLVGCSITKEIEHQQAQVELKRAEIEAKSKRENKYKENYI